MLMISFLYLAQRFRIHIRGCTTLINAMDGNNNSFPKHLRQPCKERRSFGVDVHHIVFSKCTIKCRKCGGADCGKSTPFNGRNRLLTDSLVLRFTSIVIFCTTHMMACSVVACHLTALLRHPCAQLFYHDLHAALSRPPFVAKNSKPQFLFHFPFSVAFPI